MVRCLSFPERRRPFLRGENGPFRTMTPENKYLCILSDLLLPDRMKSCMLYLKRMFSERTVPTGETTPAFPDRCPAFPRPQTAALALRQISCLKREDSRKAEGNVLRTADAFQRSRGWAVGNARQATGKRVSFPVVHIMLGTERYRDCHGAGPVDITGK